MAGIIAVAASASVLAAATAVDKNASGFITGEQIVLSTTPTGSAYSWGLSKQSGATARSDLDDGSAATPVFTPDVAGVYNITVDVDGTEYTLRLTVTQLAQSTPLEAVRFSPVADSAVPTPALGAALYYSSDQDALVTKLADGSVPRSYVLRFADVAVSAFTIDQTFQVGVTADVTPDLNALGTIRSQSAGAPLVLLRCYPDEGEVVLVFGVTGSINWVGGTADLAVQILPVAAS